jgi:hypothetical protein
MNDNSEKIRQEWDIWKAQEHRNLEIWKAEMLSSIAVYQNVNMQGQGALKAALLVNAGASVALLAFVGTTMANSIERCLLLTLCFSMLLFVFGVLCAAIASGVTYLAGLVDANGDNKKNVSKSKFWRHWWFYNGVAIILVILSYILFFVGSLNAYFAFVNSLRA